MIARRPSRANAVRFSHPLLACIAIASGACAVQPGEGSSADTATTTVATASGPSSPVQGKKGGPKPEDLGPFDLINDAKEIYNDYNQINSLLNPAPDTTAEILADLSTMEGQIESIQGQLDVLNQNLVNLTWQEAQASYLATLQDIQTYESQAQTASEELTEWQQTGGTNALLLADADNNSQLAANALKNSSFYFRPAPVANQAPIFDVRSALLPYLYALNVRIAIIGIEHPNYRNLAAYNQELAQHAAWIQQAASLSLQDVACSSSATPQSESPGSFYICSTCTDTNSKFSSSIDGTPPGNWNSDCTPELSGDTSVEGDADGFYTFYDNYRVQEELGIHLLQAFAAQVQADSVPPPTFIIRPGAYNAVAPLVSNTGLCLTADPTAGLTLEACSSGSATQIWRTADPGETAPITLVTPATSWPWMSGECVDIESWDPADELFESACTGTPSEAYTLTTTNELQSAYAPGYCLTNPGGGSVMDEPCNGSPQQQWGRAWPIYFPPPVIIRK